MSPSLPKGSLRLRCTAIAVFLCAGCDDDAGQTEQPETSADEGDSAPPQDEVIYGETEVTLVDADGDGVVALAGPIRMPDGATLDCGGLVLRSTAVDVDEPDDTRPEVGVFLPNVANAVVRNCTIEGFDFAIFAAGGGNHVFEQNTIEGDHAGVKLLSSDNNLVADNLIRFHDVGVEIGRDADLNTLTGNQLDHIGSGGGTGVGLYDAPVEEAAVINVIVDNELLQFPSADNNLDDNRVEDNVVTFPADANAETYGFYVAVRSNRTTVRRNTVRDAYRGIHLPGFDDGSLLHLPGRCAGNETRFCRGDEYDDCQIPGIDQTSLGPCLSTDELGAPAGQCGDQTCASDADCENRPCLRVVDVEGRLRVQEPTVEENIIERASDYGVGAHFTRDAIIRDNDISDGRIGISLTAYATHDGLITGNTIRGNDVGLQIEGNAPGQPGVVFTLNDLIDNDLGVSSSTGRHKALDGNFWGHGSCPGFSPIDADGDVADCAPYVVSVAAGVPQSAEPCTVESRPDELDGVCILDAPEVVTARGTQGMAGDSQFEIYFAYAGSYEAAAYGLAAAQTWAGSVEAGGAAVQYRLEVPEASRHLRVALMATSDGAHNLDLLVLAGDCASDVLDGCAVIAESRRTASNEQLDLPLPDSSYVLAIEPTVVDGDSATFELSWWIVPEAAPSLIVTAPTNAQAGTTDEVVVSWPDGLATGTWIGLVQHFADGATVGQTVVKVVLAP